MFTSSKILLNMWIDFSDLHPEIRWSSRVSAGHLLSTAQVESALVEHEAVAEAAVVGRPHPVKGESLYCFVTLTEGVTYNRTLEAELKRQGLIPRKKESFVEVCSPRHFNFYITSLIKPGFILSTVREKIGAIATPDYIQNAPGLPKTRSGKVTKLARNVNDWSDCGVAFSWTRWRFGHLTPDCAQNDVTPEWNPNVRLYLGLPPLAIPVNNDVLLLFIPWAAILESELSSWEQFEWNTPLFRVSSQCKGRLLSLALGVFSQVLHFMEHPDAEEGNGICGKCSWKDGNQLKHTASSLLQ